MFRAPCQQGGNIITLKWRSWKALSTNVYSLGCSSTPRTVDYWAFDSRFLSVNCILRIHTSARCRFRPMHWTSSRIMQRRQRCIHSQISRHWRNYIPGYRYWESNRDSVRHVPGRSPVTMKADPAEWHCGAGGGPNNGDFEGLAFRVQRWRGNFDWIKRHSRESSLLNSEPREVRGEDRNCLNGQRWNVISINLCSVPHTMGQAVLFLEILLLHWSIRYLKVKMRIIPPMSVRHPE